MRMSQPEERPDDQPARLDKVTRLNRNILVVAAMAVAVVMLTVTHVARSGPGSPNRSAGTARVETGTVADFLRAHRPDEDALPVPPPIASQPELEDDPVHLAGPLGSQPPPSSFVWSPSPYTPPPVPDAGEEALERALRARLRSQDPGSGRAVPVGSVYPAGMESRDTGPPVLSRDSYPEVTDAAAWDAESTVYARSRIVEPYSDYQIMAGTVLPAMLVTAMNSDMPGELVAQISRNIYDSQQRHLLIPRGTRVIGRYDNQVALGQSRVLVAWTRLIFPDGRSLSLPGLPTLDLRGAAGVRTRVDNHYGRLYGQAFLLSIIGAGAQLSQPQQSSILAPPSSGQVAAGALGQQLSQVSMETIRRNMDVRPTLEVRAGTPFYVFLGRDLVLDEPWVDPWAAVERATPVLEECGPPDSSSGDALHD